MTCNVRSDDNVYTEDTSARDRAREFNQEMIRRTGTEHWWHSDSDEEARRAEEITHSQLYRDTVEKYKAMAASEGSSETSHSTENNSRGGNQSGPLEDGLLLIQLVLIMGTISASAISINRDLPILTKKTIGVGQDVIQKISFYEKKCDILAVVGTALLNIAFATLFLIPERGGNISSVYQTGFILIATPLCIFAAVWRIISKKTGVISQDPNKIGAIVLSIIHATKLPLMVLLLFGPTGLLADTHCIVSMIVWLGFIWFYYRSNSKLAIRLFLLPTIINLTISVCVVLGANLTPYVISELLIDGLVILLAIKALMVQEKGSNGERVGVLECLSALRSLFWLDNIRRKARYFYSTFGERFKGFVKEEKKHMKNEAIHLPSLPSDDWYVFSGGSVSGPFGLVLLKNKLANGELQSDAMICRNGDEKWINLKEMTCFSIFCTNCGQKLEVGVEQIGQEMPCPTCGTTQHITKPLKGETAEAGPMIDQVA